MIIDPAGRLRPGQRVAVRSRIATSGPGPSLTDTVGDLVTIDTDHLVIASRRGRVRIDRDDVVAARVIPPRPGRRGAPHRAIMIEDLQRLMTAGQPPIERAWIGEERRGWLLRAAQGFTGRANSLLPVGDPGRSLDAAIDIAAAWYRERGLTPLVMLPQPEGADLRQDPLGALLLDRGWTPSPPVLVFTARVAAVADLPVDTSPVASSRKLSKEWFAACGPVAQARPEAARAVMSAPEEQAFLSIGEEGLPRAIARVAFHDGWAGLFGLHVRPAARRAGLARTLTVAAARQARERGIVSMYLQVEKSNAPAIALYQGLGLSLHHHYHYFSYT